MREARQKWPSLTLCAVGCHLLERGSPTDSFAILEPKNPEMQLENVDPRISWLYSCERVCREGLVEETRPSLSLLWNLKHGRATILNFLNLAALLILRLRNCERSGRVKRGDTMYIPHTQLDRDSSEMNCTMQKQQQQQQLTVLEEYSTHVHVHCYFQGELWDGHHFLFHTLTSEILPLFLS